MINANSKNERRQQRQRRSRVHIKGTPVRPRLCVFRSLNHIYAQVIDDQAGRTLAAVSSRKSGSTGGNLAAAQAVGAAIAARAQEQGIQAVVFDRAGYPYHGRVKALAEAAREGGLKF